MKWWWRLLDRLTCPTTVEVTLPELAQVWLQGNHGVAASPKAPQEQTKELVVDELDVRGPVPAVSAVNVTDKGPGSTHPRSPLVEQFLTPYERILREQQVWDPLCRLIGILDDLGDCPSVVMVDTEHDRESRQELYTLRETLARVTLREHTELVTHLLLQEIRNRYPDPEILMPKMLVVALGHDVGKIPSFRGSGMYSKKDHPDISVIKVRELFAGVAVPWLDDACEIIRTHHQWTKSEVGGVFKAMDGKARELEVARVTKTLSVKRWEDWFTVEGVLDGVAPAVNRVTRQGKWEAFDFGDSVFCVPELVLKATRGVAKAAQVIDIQVARDTDQEVVLRRVIGALRKAQALSYPVGEGYYGRKFSVVTPATRRKLGMSQWYLVPLKREAFGARQEKFHPVQQSLLEGVRDVQLVA